MAQSEPSVQASFVRWLRALRGRSLPAFVVVVLLIIGQGLFTLLGIEVSPFRKYGMYSQTQQALEWTEALELVADGSTYDYERIGDLRKEVLLGPIRSFQRVMSPGGDPNLEKITVKLRWLPASVRQALVGVIVQERQKAEGFSAWYGGHFEAVTGYHISERLQVFSVTYRWSGNRPYKLSKQLLFEYEAR